MTGSGPHARFADTHCHLCFDAFEHDLEQVLERASRSGVDLCVVPGTDLATSRKAVSLAGSHGSVAAAVGLHPCEEHRGSDMAEIRRLAFEPGVHAIGETGLDMKRMERPLDEQEELFQSHMSLAEATGLPLVVHSRMAEPRVLSMLDGHEGTVVLHCYTGSCREAREAADRGYFLGFSGAVTYGVNSELRRIAASLPPGCILSETDAPFMAPASHRGGRSEPAMVALTAGVIAGTRAEPGWKVAETLRENADRAFLLGRWKKPATLYILGRRAYVNPTGMCTNDCAFCVRKFKAGLGGYHLRHEGGDPPESLVLGSIGALDPDGFEELVFCGYGEPTMRPGLLEKAVLEARAAGWRTRLDTNGLAGALLGMEEAIRLALLFDSTSISLNAHDGESYARICRPSIPGSWESLIEFVHRMAASGASVRLTAVRWPGVDMDAVGRLASSLGHVLVERGGV
ncbi:YchF/TatD family DNA exonuclease [Candidatus Fermentibacteria bacterium]|nr:YchF/TatD family DNA exonuclease [Candidatus Fermentibacteria bacterium]